MSRPRIALLAVTAMATLLLSGCIGPFAPISMSKSVDIIYTVDFSQSQAVPGFDDSEYSFGEDSDVVATKWMATFHQLLKDHDIEPWNYSPRDTDGCTGVHMRYHGAGEDTIVIDGCAAEEGSFEADATTFFTTYREAHHSEEGFANENIVSLTFSQSQALEGFDTSEYTQDYPHAVGGCSDTGFVDEISSLFSGWRQALGR